MAFALHSMNAAHGALTWREAGSGPAIVLLHGIGAGAASFEGQLAGFSSSHRVIAWDAPGYGESAALQNPRPMALDYAKALDELLSHLGVGDLVLVGHSLGALMGTAWAASTSGRLRALVLAAPARGYGDAAAELRDAKWQERIDLVQRLGVEGLAAQRSAGLCAPHASPQAIETVRRNMARITPGGYAQAAHMLAHDELLPSLRKVQAPVHVLCGELDTVTPPAACRAVAEAVGASYTALLGVAHACYVEDAGQFNAALKACLGNASAD